MCACVCIAILARAQFPPTIKVEVEKQTLCGEMVILRFKKKKLYLKNWPYSWNRAGLGSESDI